MFILYTRYMGVVAPESDRRGNWVDAIFEQYKKGAFPREYYNRLMLNVISYPLDEESKREIQDRENKITYIEGGDQKQQENK